jgi:hypothetical protein
MHVLVCLQNATGLRGFTFPVGTEFHELIHLRMCELGGGIDSKSCVNTSGIFFLAVGSNAQICCVGQPV